MSTQQTSQGAQHCPTNTQQRPSDHQFEITTAREASSGLPARVTSGAAAMFAAPPQRTAQQITGQLYHTAVRRTLPVQLHNCLTNTPSKCTDACLPGRTNYSSTGLLISIVTHCTTVPLHSQAHQCFHPRVPFFHPSFLLLPSQPGHSCHVVLRRDVPSQALNSGPGSVQTHARASALLMWWTFEACSSRFGQRWRTCRQQQQQAWLSACTRASMTPTPPPRR